MTAFSIAIRIKGEWHTIATTPARIWADDIADGLIAADIRHEVQISEDGRVVATRTKEAEAATIQIATTEQVRERQAGPVCPDCDHVEWMHLGTPKRCGIQIGGQSCGCQTQPGAAADGHKPIIPASLLDSEPDLLAQLRHRQAYPHKYDA